MRVISPSALEFELTGLSKILGVLSEYNFGDVIWGAGIDDSSEEILVDLIFEVNK